MNALVRGALWNMDRQRVILRWERKDFGRLRAIMEIPRLDLR